MKSFLSVLLGLITICTLSIPSHVMAINGSPFSDLSPSDPYYDLMVKLHATGVITGNPDGSLGGEKALNRAALVAIAVRAKGIKILPEDNNCFPDIAEQWFAGPVCAMAREGLIKGYPDGLFRPERDVTAGEAAKIIINAVTSNSFDDLNEALSFLDNGGHIMSKLGRDDGINRKEAFARLLLVLENRAGEMIEAPAKAEIGVRYVDYDKAAFEARRGNGAMILFFHASWCPKCKASEKAILDSIDELTGDLTFFKADYDTAFELRKEFAVTLQDTFVAIDANGEVLKKQNGVKSAESAQALINLASSK